MEKFNIADHVVECDISYRGGILKIDVSSVFPEVEEWDGGYSGDEAIMGASQNYLGGGIAGRITTGAMFDKERLNKKQRARYEKLAEEIKRYFYRLNNGGGDDYMQENVNSFEQNQTLPISGY